MTTFEEQLDHLFLTEDAIPAEYRLPAEIHQREYLSGGEMKPWNGAVDTVSSPICIKMKQC